MDRDDILPEYDFSRAQPNKFAARCAEHSKVAVVESDLADLMRSRSTDQTVLDILDEPTGK